SVVLALAGGALGVGIAVAGVRILVTLQRGAPRIADSHVNAPVLLFALGVSLLTGLLFGLAPALQSGRAQLVSALKEGGRGTSGGASLQRTRAALTVAEVALAVVLLAGSGLLMRSFARLTAVYPGFRPSHVMVGMVRLPSARYPVEQARVTLDQLLEKVRGIRGVELAAPGSDLPLCCSGQSPISFASRPRTDEGRLPLLNVAVVDPEYFETLQIPLVSGRHIETGDRAGQPLVALVSERVAKKFFAGASPIGERLRLGGQVNDTSSWRTIVGVVRDTRTDGLTEAPRGTLYLPLASVGIYGVISYNVTQRTGEIGVRVALGAQRRDVVALVVGQAMAMAAVGVAIGVLLALWGGKSLSAMLFGVGPRDPLVLGAASVFLLAVAFAAALAPALGAMRIDPTIAMRADSR